MTRSATDPIEDALRMMPLAAPPPLLYIAVMQRVRQEQQPRFSLHWLDLALPLFASGMLGLFLLLWNRLPSFWLDYMHLMATYQLRKLWYLDPAPLIWVGVAAALFGLSLAVWQWMFSRGTAFTNA